MVSADRLVNRAIKSSKVGMLNRLQSATPDYRRVLLEFLLIDASEVRIKTLIDGGSADLAVFNPSIFADRPSTGDDARGGSIGSSVLREAAEIFYGSNQFVADDVQDLLWFASNIEPGCHGYVKSLVLSDGAFVQNPHRDIYNLCTEDYHLINALRRFPELRTIVFNFSWEMGSLIHSSVGFVMCALCDPSTCPRLEWINIARITAEPAFLSTADWTRVNADDTRLVLEINDRLRALRLGIQPMQY